MDGLYMDPVLPDETTRLQFNGITYLGNKLNYEFDSDHAVIEVKLQFKDSEQLVLLKQGKTYELKLGIPCKVGSGKFSLKPLVDKYTYL